MNENKLLYYYKNEKEKKPIKDPIKMENCKCIEANLSHERFKFVFSVVLPQRIYYLVAGTQLEMEDWVDKLVKVCGFKRIDECHSQGKCYKTLHCKLSESFKQLCVEASAMCVLQFYVILWSRLSSEDV